MMSVTGNCVVDHGKWPRNSIRLAIQKDNTELLEDLLTDRHGYSHEDLSSALRLSAELGHLQCAKILLRHNALPNVHDGGGFTPLIIAASRGHHGVLKLLIDSSSHLDKSTFRVRATALHWAATNGYLNCVQILINAGCSVDSQTIHGRTPLMLAARSDEPEIVTALLQAGANPNKGDLDNMTALHLAAEEGSLECAKILLEAGAMYNVKTKRGESPLLLAAKQGHVSVLKELLFFPDIIVNSSSHGMSIYHWVAYGGHHQCLELLLQTVKSGKHSDCDFSVLNQQMVESYFGPQMLISEGVTPLMLACVGNHTESMRILLENGADSELVDVEGMSTLLYALKNDYSHCVDILLQFGASPDHVNLPTQIHDPEYNDLFENEIGDMTSEESEKDDLQITPLFYAIERDCRSSLLALIRGGCNLERFYIGQNQECLQALELALCRGRFNIAVMLIRIGAFRNLTMSSGVQHALAVLLHKDSAMFHWLMNQLSSPPSLMSQSRWFIRKCIGCNAKDIVRKLPLPSTLIKCVNLDDLEDTLF